MRVSQYIIIMLLLTLSTVAVAQIPGYGGKRFSVNAGMGITPAFYNWVYDNKDYEGISSLPGIGLNVTPQIGAEFVLTKGAMIGGSLMMNSLNKPIDYFEDSLNGYSDYDAHGYFGETKVKSKYWSVYFKFYRYEKRGVIAPIGRFHQLEFIKGSSTVENGDVVVTNYADLIQYLENDNYAYYDSFYMKSDVSQLGFTNPIKQIYLKYAYGYETVLFDKLATTLSVQVSYPFSQFITSDDNNSYEHERFESVIRDRAWGALGFSMNLGIGYFVF